MLITIDELKKAIYGTKYSYFIYVDLKLSGICKDHESYCWIKEGELHRNNKPAVKYFSGSKEWYKNGDLHRDDGPAIERFNGYKE